MHPPEADGPADRPDAAQHQCHGLNILHVKTNSSYSKASVGRKETPSEKARQTSNYSPGQ